MTVRILTGALIGVLSDLIQTADRGPEAGVMGSVLLHTGRGHHGAEPGKVELLAGVSSDRHVAGHTYTWCTGQLRQPSLWNVRDARSVITVFKAARGKDKQGTHAVEIRVVDGEVSIREDPNLIDDGVSLAFGEGDAGHYPAPTLYRILDAPQPSTVVRDGLFVDAVARTDLIGEVLSPFVKVAKRRGEVLRVYRTHQHVPLLVQIGETYRGMLAPYRHDDDGGDAERPDADLHAPDLDHERWHRPPAAGETTEQEAGADVVQLDLDLPDPRDG
jgi:hypothetical protein